MQQGFISLHRKLLNWEWFTDVNTCHVFIYCLLRANYKPTKWRGQEIKRGEFITSLNNIATGTGLTVSQVRTAINKLKSTHELTHKGQAKNSIITVNNWSEYQLSDTQNDTQMTHKRHTNDTQMTTDNKDNNSNKENKDNNIIFMKTEKKSDPYINPTKKYFLEQAKEILGFKPYMDNMMCKKLLELSTDIDDFKETIPIVLKKIKNKKWQFSDTKKDVTVNWLLKDSNYTAVLNGAFDYESREEIVARLEKAELERKLHNEKN